MILDCGCPSQYPDWDNEDINLGGYCSHILTIPTLLHMPLAYEGCIKRQSQTINQLRLHERWPGLVLTRTGLFRGSITRLLDDASSLSRHVRYLPDPFMVRAVLHHGNVSTSRDAIRQTQMSLLDNGCIPKELYLCHLSCPRCAPKRGGEMILLLRRWRESPTLKKRQLSRSKQ